MEYEIKSQSKITVGFAELWQFRELFYFFTWRDIKVKYKQTVLGFVWAILQPFLMMLIFSVFFGKALKVPSDNVPYPVFVFSGLLLWTVFSSGVSNAGNSMVSNANIIKKIYFPRLIIPFSSILVSLFDFLMALVVFVGILIYYQTNIDYTRMIIFLPCGLLIAIISTFGIGTFLAALNIKYRDFRYVIPFLIQVLMFLTPVIYPISILPKLWMKYIIAINPMYAAIELFRNGIIKKPLDLNLILISLFSAVLFLLIGVLYFRKTEAYFADLA
jgi:lipopolysaccharide transport system permease protein